MDKKFKNQKCVLCGDLTTTTEHVFADWLLKKCCLYEKKISLLDGSDISYKKFLVPLCYDCNVVKLSKVEDRIKKGVGSENDYYIWMLKIFICILYKETLLESRVNKYGTKIANIEVVKDDFQIAKNIFKVFKNNGSFHPGLPGSVIRVPRKSMDVSFDYCDIYQVPISAMALPNEYIFFLPFDGGRAMLLRDVDKISNDLDSVLFKFHVADIGYDEYRRAYDMWDFTVDNTINIAQIRHLDKPKPFDENEFKAFLKVLGIDGVPNGKKWIVKPIKL